MNCINAKITLFLVSCIGVQEIFGAQYMKRMLRPASVAAGQVASGVRPLKIEGVRPLSEREGQPLLTVEIEDVMEQAQSYYNKFLGMQAAIKRERAQIDAQVAQKLTEQKELDEAFKQYMRTFAEKTQQVQEDCNKAKEQIDTVLIEYLGKQKSFTWSSAIFAREALVKKFTEQMAESQKQEVPYLKAMRSAESMLFLSCPSSETPFMTFMAGLVKKAQVMSPTKREFPDISTVECIPFFTPEDIASFCKKTEIEEQIKLSKQATSAADLEDQLEQKLSGTFELAPVSHHLGQLPLCYFGRPISAIPADEKNKAAQHFRNLQQDSNFKKYVKEYEGVMSPIMNTMYNIAEIVAKKPPFHEKSYLFSALGLMGGLVAYSEGIVSSRWVSLGLLGSFGLGAWALRSDMKKQNSYYRYCQGFNKASLMIENATMQNPEIAFHLSNLRRVNIGLQGIAKQYQLSV